MCGDYVMFWVYMAFLKGGKKLGRKLMNVSLALLALVLLLAVPAVGQEVGAEFGDDVCRNVNGGNAVGGDASGTGGDAVGDFSGGGVGMVNSPGFGGIGGAGGIGEWVTDSCNDSFSSDSSSSDQDQEFEQGFESGELEQPAEVTVTGDNNAVCAPIQQSGGTGNVGSEQGLQPLAWSSEDADLAGSESGIAPEQTADCAPVVGQDATAN